MDKVIQADFLGVNGVYHGFAFMPEQVKNKPNPPLKMRTSPTVSLHRLKAVAISFLLAASNAFSATPKPLQANWIWLSAADVRGYIQAVVALCKRAANWKSATTRLHHRKRKQNNHEQVELLQLTRFMHPTITRSIVSALALAAPSILMAALVTNALGDSFTEPAANYARSFEPKVKSAFLPLPPGAVEPSGWLRDWAQAAREGITGHLDEWHPTFADGWKGLAIQAPGAQPDGTGWRSFSQAQRLAGGHTAGEFPQLLVDADVLVQPGHRPRPRETATIRPSAAPVTLAALEQVRMHAVERVPQVVAPILRTACFEQLDRGHRPGHFVFKPDAQGVRGERRGFLCRQEAGAEGVHIRCDGRNLVEDAEAGFGHFLRRKTAVADRYPLERGVRDHESIAADESEQTRMKLIRAAPVVGVHEDEFRRVFAPRWNNIRPLKAQQVLLEPAPIVEADPLLEGGHGNPIHLPQAGDNLCRRHERISFADARLRSRREHRRSRPPQNVVRQTGARPDEGWGVVDLMDHIWPFVHGFCFVRAATGGAR